MTQKIKIVIALMLIVNFFAMCKPSKMTDAKEFMKYLSDDENGLVKDKKIGGIKYKLKYLPEEYLAYNTIIGQNDFNLKQKDSIIKSFNNSITFVLNIGPAEGEDFDITQLGVSNYEEFAQRIEQMAFKASDWINLKVEETEYKPTIVRMENINALERSRNFIVVFSSEKNSDKDLRRKDMCFVYYDEMFNTGTNKFIFQSKDINNIPQFIF